MMQGTTQRCHIAIVGWLAIKNSLLTRRLYGVSAL
jgi:hypothetical protein